ncbi:MAG TPA: cell division protein FtsA [Candidatus Pacearchaeota archaeon]|nr:cell division protein FtsA [Candidatus Pacearchaeota archaeon]
MSKKNIITALDIGTNEIKALSGFLNSEKEKLDFEVIGYAKEKSFGVRNGIIIDATRVTEIIFSLIKKIEEETGKRIESVYANINGSHISCSLSKSLISVSRADRKISEEDVERAIQAAKNFFPSANKEILDIFPKEFIVDGEKGIKEVVGMEGTRLETEVMIIHSFSPHFKILTKTILDSSLQINDLIPSPLASAEAVLTEQEKELGVLVLDIGAGTTGFSVFKEGDLEDIGVFPVGSGHITNDIACCLKIDIDTAEKLKIEFGSCIKEKKNNNKKIKIEGEEPLIFSQKELVDIIEARVSEIFDFVNKELKKNSLEKLPGGVVLTGGGANLKGIKEMAKKQLNLPVRIGMHKNFSSLPNDLSLSVLCGLILLGSELEKNSETPNLFKKIKKLFKVFIP